MITWGDPNERYYEHGLDRGVLYIPGKDPIAWNGLTAFDEGGTGTTSMLYRDGVVYLADADASDFSGKMSSIFFPDAFHECLGMPEATDGLYVDNQKPKPFSLSYRSLIGNGASDNLFGYQIHLVYNCMASIAPRSRASIGSTTELTTFDFDIVCTPVKLTGYRPTAHYIIDTRSMTPSRVAQLEAILYGSGSTPGAMPTPDELFDLMSYGDAITVTLHIDGYFTVEGSSENIYSTGPYSFQMDNINGTDNGDGYYTLSDGGNTDVIIE